MVGSYLARDESGLGVNGVKDETELHMLANVRAAAAELCLPYTYR
jgi:hypothetical protein